MKEFDLEKAKQECPVQTRGGKDVEILKFDSRGDFPIIGIVKGEIGDVPDSWTTQGRYMTGEDKQSSDLMMKPTKKEGWINIYRDGDGFCETLGVYEHRAHAVINRADITFSDYIDTVKIEWEE